MSETEAQVLRILYAEDSRVDALLTQTMLGKLDQWAVEVTHTESLSETVSELRSFEYDLILLDLTLPDSSHVQTVQQVQAHTENTPIIVLTGDDDARTITEIMRMGIQDYLVKGKIDTDRLSRSIRYAISSKLAAMENEKYQTRLVESQRLEAIGRLAAGIAHDINTPAQFVAGNLRYVKKACERLDGLVDQLSELIADSDSTSIDDIIKNAISNSGVDNLFKEVGSALQESLDGVDRIDGIVKSINQYVHPSNREFKQVDLNQQIDNVITVTRNEWKNVAEVTTEFDDEIPKLECYPDLLNQAFLNMIVNASYSIAEKNKHDDKKGKGSIKISSYIEDGYTKVRISDSGQGISEKDQSSIFEPFYTTKGVGVGTGQGLSQAYNAIVQVHKGHIDVESEPDQGATFTMSIPSNLSDIYRKESTDLNWRQS